jgi:hypothetical protein
MEWKYGVIINKYANSMKSIVFMGLTVKINHATELIKRWQKHSFIFFWVGFAGLQKNESVFCASAIEILIIFCAVAVF